MKKFLLLLILPLMLFTGCNKLNTYEEIGYKDFMQKIENKEDFILFVGSATCPHCELFKKTVNKVVKDYQVKIYYIDIDKFSDEESNRFKSHVNYNATPTTVFIYEGKEPKTYNRISGNKNYSYVVSQLTKEGYIKG